MKMIYQYLEMIWYFRMIENRICDIGKAFDLLILENQIDLLTLENQKDHISNWNQLIFQYR